jgi:hypothetical protein
LPVVVVFLGILIFNILGILLISGGFMQIKPANGTSLLNDPRLTIICLAIFCMLFSWVIGGLLINFLPTIWLTETGITISYFIVFKISIPWSEITGVIDRKRFNYSSTLVLAKRITLFHQILGRFYFHVSNPCFVIGEDIENRNELVSRIRSKALFYSPNYSE